MSLFKIKGVHAELADDGTLKLLVDSFQTSLDRHAATTMCESIMTGYYELDQRVPEMPDFEALTSLPERPE